MKNKSVYLAFVSLLCIVLVCVFAATLRASHSSQNDGEAEEEKTVVSLVYAFQNAQWNTCIEELVNRFENDNPHIDIQPRVRYEDRVYEDTIYKLAARDELGDIMQIKEPYAWAESGLIAQLPEHLAQQVNTICTLDGKTYGVCALGTTTGIVYNKTIFAKYGLSVPQSYDEFMEICETLKSCGVTPLGLGGKDLWHFEYWLNHFLRSDILSAEPDFLAKCSSGEKNWNDPLISTLLSHFNDLFRLGYVDDNWPYTPDGSLAFQVAEGQVAMVFSGPWLASAALSINPSLDLGWFYVPNASGETIAGDSLDVFWTISSDCALDEQRYAAAVEFLEYFYSEAVYEYIYTSMTGFSTLTDNEGEAVPKNGVMVEVNLSHELADKHISGYVGDENTPPGFEKKLLTLISRMCAGELTVAQTQALAAQYWDECLIREVPYED